MNNSGEAIGEAMRFYKLTPSDILVLYDELDLASAKTRFKSGGGAGGHNGIKSTIAHCGESFNRLRLGIGHPGHKAKVNNHVLGDFSKADQNWLAPLLQAIGDNADLLASGENSSFMNKLALSVKDDSKEQKPTKKKSHVHQARSANKPDKMPKSGPMADMLKKLFGNKRLNERNIMGFKCGIVGLPNVGKSTLFNAVTKTASAQAANYPFCTIDPNTGDVAVPDERLAKIAAIAGSKENPANAHFICRYCRPCARRIKR